MPEKIGRARRSKMLSLPGTLLSRRKVRLSTCTRPCSVATKFESAELKLKPLAPREIFGCALADRRRHVLIVLAQALKNANLLVKCLNLLLGSVGGRLLFCVEPLFQSLDLLVERLDFLFQGLNLRGLRRIGGRAVVGKQRAGKLQSGKCREYHPVQFHWFHVCWFSCRGGPRNNKAQVRAQAIYFTEYNDWGLSHALSSPLTPQPPAQLFPAGGGRAQA